MPWSEATGNSYQDEYILGKTKGELNEFQGHLSKNACCLRTYSRTFENVG